MIHEFVSHNKLKILLPTKRENVRFKAIYILKLVTNQTSMPIKYIEAIKFLHYKSTQIIITTTIALKSNI